MKPKYSSKPDCPDQMDKWTRNARLYKSLMGEGHYVEPIWAEENHGGIEYLRVSAFPIRDYGQG